MLKTLTACAVVAVALVGCASAPPVVQDAAQLSRTHGFVHATFPVVDAIDTRPGMPDIVRLRDRATGTNYALQRATAHGANAYGLWMPAGTYDILAFKNRDGSDYERVTVAQGRVTDLGALIPIPIGDNRVGTAVVRHPETLAERAAVLADFAPVLSSPEPILWGPAVPPQSTRLETPTSNMGLIGHLLLSYERHVNKAPLSARMDQSTTQDGLLDLARSAAAPGTDEVAVSADGAVYWGALLGQVRVRSSAGAWSSIDTGTLQRISAVEMEGNRLVAGTDRGELLVRDPGTGAWQRAAGLGAALTILDIDRVGNRWLVIAADVAPARAPVPVPLVKTYEVYTTTADDLSGLTRLRRADLPNPSYIFGGQHGRGVVDGDAYFIHGFNADPVRLDLKTLAFQDVKGSYAVWMHVAADASVITATSPAGGWSKLHLSTDHGTTWRRIDQPPYPIFDVQFESPTEGYATRWTRGGMFTTELEFMTYDPKRDAWTVDHTAPVGCVRPLRNARQIHQYCLTKGGSVLNWANGQWQAEFAAN